MESLNIQLTAEMLAMVPIAAAIIQLLKGLEILEQAKNWIPFIGLAISCGLAYLTKLPQPIYSGIIIGLVANGGYDLLRAPTKTKEAVEK